LFRIAIFFDKEGMHLELLVFLHQISALNNHTKSMENKRKNINYEVIMSIFYIMLGKNEQLAFLSFHYFCIEYLF